MRKILNKKDIYLEDHFQNAYENIYMKFRDTEDYSDESSDETSIFTISS